MGVEEDDLLGELGMSALSEAMNQLMAGAATALSDGLEERIDISPPTISTSPEPEEVGRERCRCHLSGRDRRPGPFQGLLEDRPRSRREPRIPMAGRPWRAPAPDTEAATGHIGSCTGTCHRPVAGHRRPRRYQQASVRLVAGSSTPSSLTLPSSSGTSQ